DSLRNTGYIGSVVGPFLRQTWASQLQRCQDFASRTLMKSAHLAIRIQKVLVGRDPYRYTIDFSRLSRRRHGLRDAIQILQAETRLYDMIEMLPVILVGIMAQNGRV